ncbi:MAG: glycosyltransferase, partial [Glaciecola sp.]
IKIVHKSGEDMQALMLASDAVSIFVKPQEYWEFAAPVKLYEYLGYRKPIITSHGTLAGKFVSDNKIGWSLPYTETDLHELFDQLISTPQLLVNTQQQMNNAAQNHTWQSRAKQVVKDLTQ